MTTLFISHSSKDKRWAGDVHAALHQKGYRSLFLDSHPDDGISAGADWEKTLYHRLRQSRAVVLCTPNWLASPWCIAEVMMARRAWQEGLHACHGRRRRWLPGQGSRRLRAVASGSPTFSRTHSSSLSPI